MREALALDCPPAEETTLAALRDLALHTQVGALALRCHRPPGEAQPALAALRERGFAIALLQVEGEAARFADDLLADDAGTRRRAEGQLRAWLLLAKALRCGHLCLPACHGGALFGAERFERFRERHHRDPRHEDTAQARRELLEARDLHAGRFTERLCRGLLPVLRQASGLCLCFCTPEAPDRYPGAQEIAWAARELPGGGLGYVHDAAQAARLAHWGFFSQTSWFEQADRRLVAVLAADYHPQGDRLYLPPGLGIVDWASVRAAGHDGALLALRLRSGAGELEHRLAFEQLAALGLLASRAKPDLLAPPAS